MAANVPVGAMQNCKRPTKLFRTSITIEQQRQRRPMRGDGRFGKRRILCVFPRYTRAFGTWEHAYPLTDGVQAFMPPQGLLVVAAYLPADWEVRFVDENIRSATPDDFTWAEAVFVSGMHIQKG